MGPTEPAPPGATGDLAAALTLPEFPRAAAYDPAWMLENLMGPNAVWLAEALAQVMDLRPGQRVLDMGCGRAISSIFLAREFGVQVWATDLWVAASDNWRRIRAAGLADRVFPLHAEAHALPFADDFFDAAVSLDAYHYFGTDDLYLAYYARFVKPGGQLGIVVPGLRHELADGLPAHLAPYWEPDFWSFHSPDWWRAHWERTGPVAVEHADLVPDGWRHWLRWLEVAAAHGYRSDPQEAEMLRADAGRNLGFARVVARKV
ncbi:MAG TPA: methyltransferase domain-containing protein [Thermomicrobiales bacterium]|nr:methyltransferase domain-containing protein [Thermomicrobiales bacterium]